MVDPPCSQIWRTASIASRQLSYHQRYIWEMHWSHLKGELVWAQLKKWVQGYSRPTSLTDLEDCIHQFRATQLPPDVYGRYVDHISKVSWYGHSWRNGSRAMVDQPRSQIWRTASIASEQLSYNQRCVGDTLITSQRWSHLKGELVWAQLKKWVQGYGRPTSLTDLEDCIHRFRATQLHTEVCGRYIDHISKVITSQRRVGMGTAEEMGPGLW